MKHNKFREIATLVHAGVPVLLTGEKGTGKTTLAMQVAEALEFEFYSLSMTRQTTLSHLLGFISVNGTYVKSHLRTAAECGGLMLLDELDAADPNVVLSLNTIENGYITFPDAVVKLHENFRLMATANPQSSEYNGRSKLDAATLDRFDKILVERDNDLEASLVDPHTHRCVNEARRCLDEHNTGIYISMRDALRFQKRKELNLLNGFTEQLFGEHSLAFSNYKEAVDEVNTECAGDGIVTLKDLWDKSICTEKDTDEWKPNLYPHVPGREYSTIMYDLVVEPGPLSIKHRLIPDDAEYPLKISGYQSEVSASLDASGLASAGYNVKMYHKDKQVSFIVGTDTIIDDNIPF